MRFSPSAMFWSSERQLWCSPCVSVGVRGMLERVHVVAVLVALLFPAAASAGSFSVIPPSNAGANQYMESVPTAGGSRSSTPSGATAQSTPQAGSISPSTQAELNHQGADGRRADALARRFAPVQTHRRSRALGPSGRIPGASPSGGGPSGGGAAGGGGSGGGASGGGSAGPSASGGGSSASGSWPLGTLVQALVGSGAGGASGALVPIALILSAFGVGAVARRRRSG
jgi:hypothetical protein